MPERFKVVLDHASAIQVLGFTFTFNARYCEGLSVRLSVRFGSKKNRYISQTDSLTVSKLSEISYHSI